MTLNFIQLFFVGLLIIGAVGVLVSMLLLTWTLVISDSKISSRTAGKWIVISFALVTVGYMLLMLASR